jgi:hypothetical protein
MPPTIPAIKPDKGGAPEATAIPKQSGSATKKTTRAEGKSSLRFDPKYFLNILNYRWCTKVNTINQGLRISLELNE